MDLQVLTPESEQRLEWRKRTLLWMMERISGSAEDKAQFLDIFHAALSTAYEEGQSDAAHVVRTLHDTFSSHDLKVASDALDELLRRNKRDHRALDTLDTL